MALHMCTLRVFQTIVCKTYPKICLSKTLQVSTALQTQLHQHRCFFKTPFLLDSSAETVKAADETVRDTSKDRTKIIPVETSIAYLESEAFHETYKLDPVWKEYRRNHKGAFPPYKTRKTCIRQGEISTGNPCPICRDEYLVLDYRNVKLLKQFICPHTGKVLSFTKTGLCQKKHTELVVAVEKARDYGFLIYDVPTRIYNYADYYQPA